MAAPKIKVTPPTATEAVRDRMHNLLCDAASAADAAAGHAQFLEDYADTRHETDKALRIRALVRMAEALASDIQNLADALDRLWSDSGAQVAEPYARRIAAPQAEGGA